MRSATTPVVSGQRASSWPAALDPAQGLSGLPLAASTDPVSSYLLGVITAYVTGFIATWIIGFDDPPKE